MAGLRAPGPRPGVEQVRRRYGAHPAHLIAIVAGFAVVALAARPLLAENPVPVARWFAGSAILHDAVLVPAYVALDGAAVALWRRRPGNVSWLNFVRIPTAVAAMLLLVWYPLITSKAESFHRATGRSTTAYRPHWLFVTALVFAISALCYLARVATVARSRGDRRPPTL